MNICAQNSVSPLPHEIIHLKNSDENNGLQDQNGSDAITLRQINEKENMRNIALDYSLYPNPVSNISHLNCDPNKIDKIILTTVEGKYQAELPIDRENGHIRIDLEKFSPGVYFLHIYSARENKTLKLIKL